MWRRALPLAAALAATLSVASAPDVTVAGSGPRFTPPQAPCPGPDWWTDTDGKCYQGCVSNSQKRNPETQRCLCGGAPPDSACMTWAAEGALKCCGGECVGSSEPSTTGLHSGSCENEGGGVGAAIEGEWGASFLSCFVVCTAVYVAGNHRRHTHSRRPAAKVFA